MSDKPDGAGRIVFLGAVIAILATCVFQMVWAMRTREAIEQTKASLARLEEMERTLASVEDKVGKMADDQDFLVDDITRMTKKMDDLVASMENRGGPVAEPEADEAPQIDWTSPQLFEKARTSCAEYGIALAKDEVRVPSRFIPCRAPIEYFAVLKGGKEHETLISVVGSTAKGERRPKDFGARLNNAIQAIGFKRGKPVRFTQSGRVPPEGETAYLFIEWEEKGEKVLVRAEDLVWNRVEERPMQRGRWIYVGSHLVKMTDDPDLVFAADITGEVIATYSSPETIFDNVSQYDSDDTVFLVATPRIPLDVEDCTLVIRRADREATRTFPDPPAASGDPPKTEGAPSGQGR